MALREIMIWIIQAVLFGIGIGFAGLAAHLAGPLLATAFAIDELIPTAFVSFAVLAGLGWEALSKENPRLVMVRVSGWGQDGPYRDRPGFGTMVEAMSGFAATTGPAESPTLPSFPMADMVAAQAGAVAPFQSRARSRTAAFSYCRTRRGGRAMARSLDETRARRSKSPSRVKPPRHASASQRTLSARSSPRSATRD